MKLKRKKKKPTTFNWKKTHESMNFSFVNLKGSMRLFSLITREFSLRSIDIFHKKIIKSYFI